MPFECEECGLEKEDKEKNEVIDGNFVKLVCNDCLDLSKHICLTLYTNEEINKRILEISKPKNILEKISGVKVAVDKFRRIIRMERIKRGLSIEQLASILKIKAEDIEKFEKGYKEDLYIRKKLMEFFKINLIDREKFKNKEVAIDFKSNIKLHELIE